MLGWHAAVLQVIPAYDRIKLSQLLPTGLQLLSISFSYHDHPMFSERGRQVDDALHLMLNAYPGRFAVSNWK